MQGLYYDPPLDLTAYLQSHVGSIGSYRDLVTIYGPSYPALDQYGFEGTATLTKVTVAPEPEVAELVCVGLAILGFVARRAKERA